MQVFIDESGDEGTGGRGTRWLTFGCVMVQSADQSSVEQILSKCATTLAKGSSQPRRIHFKQLTHADKRGICSALSGAKWNGIVAASDTSRIRSGSWLRNPTYQYNYPLRYVIERVSWRAKELGVNPPRIWIERRRNFDVAEFRKYMKLLRSRDDSNFAWDHFDPDLIDVADSRSEPLLCIADGLAHALFKALEPDQWWGHYELAYLNLLKTRLWQGSIHVGREGLINNGIVLLPTSEWALFVGQYPWLLDL